MTPAAAWDDCLRALGASEEAPQARLHALVTRWDEPHRHYHTRGHLMACLAGWQRLRGSLHAPAEAGLALLYHDAIYDPQRRDNEALSVELARADLTVLGVPAGPVERIVALIQATDHRTATTHPDAAAVIDIDLAILGADPAIYRRYAADVRQEYAHVAEADWLVGRAAVLRHFLQRPRLFTSGLSDALEAPARFNLEAELATLS